MQNHIILVDGLLHDRLSPESFHTTPTIEDAVPVHLAVRSYNKTTDTNKASKDDRYRTSIKMIKDKV